MVGLSETSAVEKGGTAANFLRIRVGARAVGLGEAYVGVSDDSYSTYWNPGGLSQLKDREIGAMYNKWGEGEGQGFFTYAFPLSGRRNRAIGLFCDYYEFGAGEQADEYGNIIKYKSSSDLAFGASCSQEIYRNIYGGVNLKYIHQKLIRSVGSGPAFGLGILWKKPIKKIQNLDIGLAIHNFGPKLKFDSGRSYSLPTDYRLGLAWTTFDKKLRLAFDIDKPIEDDLYFCIGSEIQLVKDLLVLRAGYNTKIGEVANGITIGFGFSTPVSKYLKFDYAFVPYGSDLGNTHRISGTMRFGKEWREAKARRKTTLAMFSNCKNIYASARGIISGPSAEAYVAKPKEEPIQIAWLPMEERDIVFRGAGDSRPFIDKPLVWNAYVGEKAMISVPIEDTDGVKEVYITMWGVGIRKQQFKMQGPDGANSGNWIYETDRIEKEGKLKFSIEAEDNLGNEGTGKGETKVVSLWKPAKPKGGIIKLFSNIVTFPISVVEDGLWVGEKVVSFPFKIFGLR